MIYSVYDYTKESKVALENFEEDLKNKISSFIDPDSLWKCMFKLSLERRIKGQPIDKFSSNASFSFKNSYEVSNKAKILFEKGVKHLESTLNSNHAVSLVLTFVELSETEIEERKLKNSKREDLSGNSFDRQEEMVFIPQSPLYSFSKVILSEDVRNEIVSAINILKYQDLIYNRWGFNEIDPVPKSVLNFYGPPGTGKTMCAHGIADELKKPLLALNYAEIESKYVGEAPKNLVRAFNAAKKYDAVLFFDEADSFLGKRIQNVTQGAEQALNSLRSQMLMLLEQHSGIIIFATNLVSNFDSAFESRILKHIKFELPNKEARAVIIKNMLPSRLPWETPISLSEIDKLAELSDGLSGRELKGVVLETLLIKVSEDGESSAFSFEDFKKRFEHKKEEKKKLKEEADAKLKQKITNALNRQIAASEDESKQSEKAVDNTNSR